MSQTYNLAMPPAGSASWVETTYVPAGGLIMWPAAAAPSGWLLCDGASYLRADYPALFAAIGVAYGSADGTHFNVPDMQGRVPAGYAAGGNADVATLGNNEGVALANRRPAHNHTFTQPTISKPGVTVTDPGHGHTSTQPTISQPAVNITDPGHVHTLQVQGGTTAATTGTHIMTSAATGGSSRAAASPDGANSHTTGVTAALAGAPVATNAAVASNTTGVTAALAATPLATGGAAGVGGSAPVDQPAFLVVSYIIKT